MAIGNVIIQWVEIICISVVPMFNLHSGFQNRSLIAYDNVIQWWGIDISDHRSHYLLTDKVQVFDHSIHSSEFTKHLKKSPNNSS